MGCYLIEVVIKTSLCDEVVADFNYLTQVRALDLSVLVDSKRTIHLFANALSSERTPWNLRRGRLQIKLLRGMSRGAGTIDLGDRDHWACHILSIRLWRGFCLSRLFSFRTIIFSRWLFIFAIMSFEKLYGSPDLSWERVERKWLVEIYLLIDDNEPLL